jgi:hypothetical protein
MTVTDPNSLVSIGLVVSEEKIFEKAYDIRRTPSDGNSSQMIEIS